MSLSLPSLYYFNPTNELATANNTVSFQPNSLLTQFENDLAFLPAYLAQAEDVVLMHKYEDLQFIDFLYQLGFRTAGQVLRKDIWASNQKILSDIERFVPWGWSPNMIHHFKKINHIHSQEALPIWNDATRNSINRENAQQVLQAILKKSEHDIYLSEENTPKNLNTLNEIESFVLENYPVVLKEPWSASARGNIVLRKSNLNTSLKQRIRNVLKKQGFMMAEKWHHKICDLSLHFKVNRGYFEFVSESYFETDSNGQYQASFINSKPDLSLSDIIFIDEYLPQVIEDLTTALNNNASFKWYTGNMGVDLMLILEQEKKRFHPCLEINLRNTMGTVALHIQKQVHPKAKGRFQVVLNPEQSFEKHFENETYPFTMADGKLIKGNIPLVSPKEKKFGATLYLQ